jgi:putative ABC transport system permease protein
MLRITLAQMRRSLGRLAAAGIAIAIGTAFVTATLITGDLIERTSTAELTARFGDADLVVSGPVTAELLSQVSATEGVVSATPLVAGQIQVWSGSQGEQLMVVAQPSDPAFDTLEAVDGRLARPGEITLPASTANRLGLSIGDTVTLHFPDPATGEEQDGTAAVAGIVEDPRGAWSLFGGAGTAVRDDVLRWSGTDLGSSSEILVRAEDAGTAKRALAAVAGEDYDVRTKQEAAQQALAELSDDGGQAVVMLVLGFAAVALLVAGLVIANTFQVLVAQRTRTLALLRCVGARRGQLRASVLLEAGVLGIGASLVGLVTGSLLAQSALWVLHDRGWGQNLPTTIALSAATIAVPIIAGTVVTVASSLVPARAATRVSPIAALRPADAPEVRSGAGSVRLAFSLVLSIGGLAALALVVAASRAIGSLGSLGLGVLLGAVSFVGVLVGTVFWVPKVVGAVGGLLARSGTSARLAAANAVRNPRRTAATSTALLIGVTLVAMMSTGAASARTSLAGELDSHYPVDMVLTSSAYGDDGYATALPASTLEAARGVPGVAEVVALPTSTIQTADGAWATFAVDPDEASGLLRNGELADALRDGTVLTSMESLGERATLTQAGVDLTLDVTRVEGLGQQTLVTPATMATIDAEAPASTAWVRFTKGADPTEVLQDVRKSVGGEVFVESQGAERADYESTIDTLLAIVVGLLGVAVLIALIGVANTLSLSVLERRRESATLRAIGLSRRQLRLSLGLEGMLIAGVGALLGAVLGLVYGWAGSAIVFGTLGDVRLAVPWDDLAVLIAVAVAAGLLASVLPARRAARTSPVAALAVD